MAAETTDDPEPADADVEALRARIGLLEAENRALRQERVRRHRTRYRRLAAGLAGVGLVATLAALGFPGARDVLFALGATGLFAGLLTYYLTPERFVAANVGAASYDAYAASVESMVDELGLVDARVYVPRDAAADPVRLFLPQHADYALPDRADLESLFVVTDEPGERGVSLHPTGVPLFRELGSTLSGPVADEPGPLADQLVDGLVEAFELAERATADVADGRITVGVAGVAFGDVARVDHPVHSLLAVGLAAGLERPITVAVTSTEDGRADHLVTCRWSTDGEADAVDGPA